MCFGVVSNTLGFDFRILAPCDIADFSSVREGGDKDPIIAPPEVSFYSNIEGISCADGKLFNCSLEAFLLIESIV